MRKSVAPNNREVGKILIFVKKAKVVMKFKLARRPVGERQPKDTHFLRERKAHRPNL